MMFLAAIFPIAFLIFLMVGPRALPSQRALPLSALVAYLTVLLFFGLGANLVHASALKGLFTALTPILIIWGALLLFRMMEESGALATLKTWLTGVTKNRVGLLMILGWAFPFLLEGASGFGTPVAIAAPILLGLGFPAMPVALMVLVMNTAPVSFGAVGTPTWFGFSQLTLSIDEITAIGVNSAWIHGIASLIVPLFALRFVVPWKTIGRNLGFVFISLLSTLIPFVIISYGNYEFPALAGGLIGTLVSVAAARLGIGLSKNAEDQLDGALPGGSGSGSGAGMAVAADLAQKPRGADLARALFPILGTLLILVVTRIPALGLKGLLTDDATAAVLRVGDLGLLRLSPALVIGLQDIFGTGVSASHQLLYVPSIIPFALIVLVTALLYRMKPEGLGRVWKATAKQMRNPAVALFGALVFVEILSAGGEQSAVREIGSGLAQATGGAWPAFSSLLGALGAFFSGSNTISNLTFGGIQDSIALAGGFERTVILALQSVGGAMGHMIALHNIVAVTTVLAMGSQEGTILKRLFPILLLYALVAGILGFILPLLG